METILIKGNTLQFDVFDLDEMERYFDEVDRVQQALTVSDQNERPVDRLRRVCEAVLDCFDALFGDGTAQQLFGDKINVKEIMSGYAECVDAINVAISGGTAELKNVMQAAPAAPRNRAERRAAKP